MPNASAPQSTKPFAEMTDEDQGAVLESHRRAARERAAKSERPAVAIVVEASLEDVVSPSPMAPDDDE